MECFTVDVQPCGPVVGANIPWNFVRRFSNWLRSFAVRSGVAMLSKLGGLLDGYGRSSGDAQSCIDTDKMLSSGVAAPNLIP